VKDGGRLAQAATSGLTVSILTPRTQGTVTLNDGRRLGYAEYGVAAGRPVLWFHGTPGARRQLTPRSCDIAAELGIRIVMPERPGIGGSTPHLYGQIVDWADDMAQLTQTLAIDEFAVMGLSGGGPYVLACAHEMPERVVMGVPLGSVAPSIGPEAPQGGIVSLLRRLSPVIAFGRGPLGHGLSRLVERLEPFADQAMDLFMLTMPPGDRRVFSDAGTREVFQQDLVIGNREGGMQAMFNDMVLFGRPWGFSLRNISVPIRLWHGDADNLVPLAHAEHMASLLTDAQVVVRPQEGHLGGLSAAEDVFRAILQHWPNAT